MASYNGMAFRTPLEARWAAFFDLAHWKWALNPLPEGNWAPDFRVTLPCEHSECGGSHTLLISILAVDDVQGFKGHPCLTHAYGKGITAIVDAGAGFGTSPQVTTWEMQHGSGGGIYSVSDWVETADDIWTKAGTLVS